MFGSVHPEAAHVEAYFSPVTKYQSGIINECMPLVSVHLLDHSGTQSMEYARKRLKSLKKKKKSRWEAKGHIFVVVSQCWMCVCGCCRAQTKYGQHKGRDEKLRQDQGEAFQGPPLGGRVYTA